MVGRHEGLMDALLGEHQLAHAVVVEGDQRIGQHGQFVERGLRLISAALALEGERHGGKHHHEGAFLAGDAGDDGSRAGTGATAEAHAEENNAAAFECRTQLRLRLEHRLVAEFRITAGAQAFGQVRPELDFLRCHARAERADVGIEREQLRSLHAIQRDAFQHVAAGAAEADDFNG